MKKMYLFWAILSLVVFSAAVILSGVGFLVFVHMGGSHILSNKNRKQKRKLRSQDIVDKVDMKRITPYI